MSEKMQTKNSRGYKKTHSRIADTQQGYVVSTAIYFEKNFVSVINSQTSDSSRVSKSIHEKEVQTIKNRFGPRISITAFFAPQENIELRTTRITSEGREVSGSINQICGTLNHVSRNLRIHHKRLSVNDLFCNFKV